MLERSAYRLQISCCLERSSYRWRISSEHHFAFEAAPAQAPLLFASIMQADSVPYYTMFACPWAGECLEKAWKRARVWGWNEDECRNYLNNHRRYSSKHASRQLAEGDEAVEQAQIEKLTMTSKEAQEWQRAWDDRDGHQRAETPKMDREKEEREKQVKQVEQGAGGGGPGAAAAD